MSDPTPQQAYRHDAVTATAADTLDTPSWAGIGTSSARLNDSARSNDLPRLSAAQLMQQQHEATQSIATVTPEYSVDPFPPAAVDQASSTPIAKKPAQPINLEDESAFPSLSMGAGKKAAGIWGASGSSSAAHRIKAPTSNLPNSNGAGGAYSPVRSTTPGLARGDHTSKPITFTEIVSLSAAEIHIHSYGAGGNNAANRSRGSQREAEPTTLGEVMKLIMKKHPSVTVEASTSRNVTTFILKGKTSGDKNGQDEVSAAKRELLGRLAKRISIELEIPAGLRGFIVGAKGSSFSFLAPLL